MAKTDIAYEHDLERPAKADRAGTRWPLAGIALQNLGRRRVRTLLLVAAVAIGSGVVFTSAVLMRSIESSMAVGFTRLGADLLVVPEGTLTNITAALLAAEPTELTLDAGLRDGVAVLEGVRRVAPQRILRTQDSGYGHHHETVDLIAFDPASDLTVQPWLEERLHRPLQTGDVIIGGRREDPLGSELLLFGQPVRVYGRLGRTGVGTHERGLFMTFETMDRLAEGLGQSSGATRAGPDSDGLSSLLVELAPGATEQQVRFAILANFPGVKVVAGESMLTSVRQGLAALLSGILALMVIMFLSAALMVSVLFSAIITERRHELGLLKAIGARRGQIVGMILVEAGAATAVGGLAGVVLGVLLLRFYEHSMVYHLEDIGVPFVWLDAGTMILLAVSCILLASAIGAAGALYPAWRASGREPYDLIRGDG
jgi:putative ABC transport system permease protein